MFRQLICLFTFALTACGGGGGDNTSTANNTGGSVDVPVLTPPAAVYSQSPHQRNFSDESDLTDFFKFFDHTYLNRVDILITQQQWDAFLTELENDILSDRYFPVNVIISSPSGLHLEVEQVGMRIRGNTTRQVPQQQGRFMPVHFKLKFNTIFDQVIDSLPYKVRKKRRVANLRSLNLKSRSRIPDNSQIRELYAYDLFNQVGVTAPLTGSARVFLTIGQFTVDYGYYTAVEPIDKTFLRKRFGDDHNEGNLYKCLWQAGGPATLAPRDPNVGERFWLGVSDELGYNPTYDLKTNEDEPDHQRLKDFIDNLDKLYGEDLKQYLDEHFEIDQFLKFSAMNVLIGMPDDYRAMGNNYYLYFTESEDDDDDHQPGKIVFVPYDYDQALGGGWQPFEMATVGIYDWADLSGQFSGNPYWTGHPLVDKVLDIPAYRQQYENYLKLYVDPVQGNFSVTQYLQKFNVLKTLYDADDNGIIESQVEDNVSMMQSDLEESYINTKVESIRSQLGL